MRRPQFWCGTLSCKCSSSSTFLNASFHDCFSTNLHISELLCVRALRALIGLNGPEQPRWVSHGCRRPISVQPRASNPCLGILKGSPALAPSPGRIWNVWCGHVSSPVSCCSSPFSLALVHGLQLMDSVPSTWLCLPCSDLVGQCPTAKVAIYAGVTLSSPSLDIRQENFFLASSFSL